MDGETTNLLRPNQVEDAKEELSRISAMLEAPPHIRAQISDRPELMKRRSRLGKQLEQFSPRPYGVGERDAAVREFNALAETIREGMPSSEEMRRNPPGAVGKQIAWDKSQKRNVMRYKHIGLRLAAGGDVPNSLRHEGDISNIERLRPLTTSNQLAMDSAQIPKATDFHIGTDPANAVTFTDAEIETLTELNPELAGQLAVMEGPARAMVKALLAKLPPAAEPEPVRTGPNGRRSYNMPENAADGTPNYNKMKQIAAANGIPAYGVKKDVLLWTLRERGLLPKPE